jgi:caa(3)-type oxidase subunit IV
MSARYHSPIAYAWILAALIVLTFLTVGVSFLPLASEWHLAIGLAIGLCKASLVGLFFMHLIDAQPSVWAVVVVSLFWLIIVFGALTLSDYLTRSWIPIMPGH